MAYDKVVDSAALDGALSGIADAIRGKTGGIAPLSLDDMAEAIAAIETGGGSDGGAIDSLVDGSITEYSGNVTSIIDSAFSNCSSLTKVSCPNVIRIYSGAFSGCKKLSDVYLPKVETIASNSFRDCTSLVEIDFPKASGFNNQAFMNCTSLVTVILRKTETICTIQNTLVFNNTPIAKGTGYVYVPRALVDTYKTATNWATFANQIRAIEDYAEICGEVSA